MQGLNVDLLQLSTALKAMPEYMLLGVDPSATGEAARQVASRPPADSAPAAVESVLSDTVDSAPGSPRSARAGDPETGDARLATSGALKAPAVLTADAADVEDDLDALLAATSRVRVSSSSTSLGVHVGPHAPPAPSDPVPSDVRPDIGADPLVQARVVAPAAASSAPIALRGTGAIEELEDWLDGL